MESGATHCSSCPRAAMNLIGEIEEAECCGDLATSESISGKIYPDFEVLDSKIASGLRKKKDQEGSKYQALLKKDKHNPTEGS